MSTVFMSLLKVVLYAQPITTQSTDVPVIKIYSNMGAMYEDWRRVLKGVNN